MKVMSVGFKGPPPQKGSAAAGEGKKESLLHTVVKNSLAEGARARKSKLLIRRVHPRDATMPGRRPWCPALGPSLLRSDTVLRIDTVNAPVGSFRWNSSFTGRFCIVPTARDVCVLWPKIEGPKGR